MERIQVTQIVGYVFKIIIVIFTLFVLTELFVSFEPAVKFNQAEKFTIELAENIMTSNLTVSGGVFDATLVASYNGKVTEPFVRQCKYAYSLTFICKDERRCDANNIEKLMRFGYKGIETPLFSKTYPIGYVIQERDAEYYNDAIPVELQINVYDTALSQVSCAVEKAYKLREPQELRCLGYDGKNCRLVPSFFYGIGSDSSLSEPNICLLDPTGQIPAPCTAGRRYFPDVNFKRVEPPQDMDTYRNVLLKAKIFRALPVKRGFENAITSIRCPESWPMPGPNDDVVVVVCVEA